MDVGENEFEVDKDVVEEIDLVFEFVRCVGYSKDGE